MANHPWIGRADYSWAYDDDDEDDKKARKEEQRRRERYMAEWAAKEREEVRRMVARTEELLAYEPFKAAARAKLAKEHPVIVGGSLVATLLAKLFDES